MFEYFYIDFLWHSKKLILNTYIVNTRELFVPAQIQYLCLFEYILTVYFSVFTSIKIRGAPTYKIKVYANPVFQ